MMKLTARDFLVFFVGILVAVCLFVLFNTMVLKYYPKGGGNGYQWPMVAGNCVNVPPNLWSPGGINNIDSSTLLKDVLNFKSKCGSGTYGAYLSLQQIYLLQLQNSAMTGVMCYITIPDPSGAPTTRRIAVIPSYRDQSGNSLNGVQYTHTGSILLNDDAGYCPDRCEWINPTR